jgi:hypothetical protein
MMADLAALLPRILPKAIAWAEARSAEIVASGVPLSDFERRLAHLAGVYRPELVRVCEVASIPRPDDPELREAALMAGMLGPGTIGLTLGYGIYILKGHRSNRLVSHECRHVYQYEVAGSIAAFLPRYLEQVLSVGYAAAPFEVDAREHERDTA